MFVVFFVLFYGILTYGLIFAAQQTVNLAAQDGARALLRWSPNNTSVVDAVALAKSRLQWISAMSGSAPAISVQTCSGPRAAAPAVANSCSGGQKLSLGQTEFVVSYSYGAAPLIPVIPLLGTLMAPANMLLRAGVAVDPGYSNGASTAIGV